MKFNVEKIRKTVNEIGEIAIKLDYRKTVEQLIKEGGCYLEDQKINSINFPAPIKTVGREIEAKTKLFVFDRHNMARYEIISFMNQTGYRPATLHELLSFALFCPEPSLLINVFALNSMMGDMFSSAPCLALGSSWRPLDLIWFNDSLKFHPVFLGILNKEDN